MDKQPQAYRTLQDVASREPDPLRSRLRSLELSIQSMLGERPEPPSQPFRPPAGQIPRLS